MKEQFKYFFEQQMEGFIIKDCWEQFQEMLDFVITVMKSLQQGTSSSDCKIC
jgi:hypothetical protein